MNAADPDRSEARATASWRLLVWSLAVCPMVVGVTSPRVFLAPHPLDLLGGASPDAQAAFASQVYRLLMLGLAVVAGGLVLAWRGRLAQVALRSPLLLGGGGLALSLLAAAAFGTRPRVAPGLLVWPLLFAAIAAIPPIGAEALLRLLRRSLRAMIALSALAAAVLPGWAIESDYTQGFIAGWTLRLHGILPHANSLGPFCAILVLLELQQRGRWRWLLAAGAGAVLLATQSKTSIAAAAVGGALLLAGQAVAALRARLDARLAMIAAGWGLAFCATVLVLLWPWLSSQADELFADRGEQIRTLTGRTELWRITLDTWRANPWFGDGAGLWDQEMQERYASILGWRPGHAHNQTIQALGQGGFAGLAAWIAYLLVLAWASWRALPGRAGLSWSLLAVVVLASQAEPWFSRDLPAKLPLLLVVHVAFTALASPRTAAEPQR